VELVLNRPDKLNALTTEMFAAMQRAVEDLRTRPDLRVLLIRATGRYFCAGVDLTKVSRHDYRGSPAEARNWMRSDLSEGMHRLYLEMEKVEKPIVVAHHATCCGGGLEMSLSCDFRLAAKSASYWFPEMKFGMLPLSGGVGKLTRVVGAHWAKWMSVANEKVSADKAMIMGLVHDVYPDETFEADVKAFCLRIASYPEEAVAVGKLAIDMAQDLGADQARALERLTFSSLTFSPEQQELARQTRERLGGK
jgi:enoyl-CoA hydratase/carnithine racemase